jgi:hypothetical protein
MITRSQIRRQLRSQGGIMNVVGRQKYGLGSFVKKAFGKAKDVVSDVVKSPIGKAALIAAGGYYLGGGNLFGLQRAGMSGFGMGNLPGIGGMFAKSGAAPFTNRFAQDLGMKQSTGILSNILGASKSNIAKLVGAGGLLGYFTSKGIAPEEAEQLSQDVYRGKGAGLDMIKADMEKYKSGESSESELFAKGYNFLPQKKFIRQGSADGGRIGLQSGGVSMSNTRAQNIAANQAQNQVNQANLNKGRARLPGNKTFNVFMTPQGTVAKDQGIAQLARDTGKAPQIQNYAINSGTDISRMIGPGTGIGVGNQSYGGGQTYSNLGFAALQPATTSNQTTAPTTIATTTTTPDLSKQAEAFGQYMNQLVKDTYGTADDYRAEAATLGMPVEAYFDYLTTSDPKNIMYSARKKDPYYDPQFDMPRDPNEIQQLSPLNIYYQNQLQKQIDQGIPEAERIQKGQVLGLPGMLPTSGTTPNIYESYEDALSRTKTAMGLASGGRAGYDMGGLSTIERAKALFEERDEAAPAPSPDMGSIKQLSNEDKAIMQQAIEAMSRDVGPMYSDPDGNEMTSKQFQDAMSRITELENMTMPKRKPSKSKGGMMSIPVRQNSGGITELDYRKSGGFVPVGIKEKADDVPAMLSKNEFVMTADAVRAAGGGSIEKGAQRMYNQMKQLEGKMA